MTGPTGPERHGDAELLLITMRGNQVGEIFPLDTRRPLLIIGREDASDVQVLDAEVSRRHAALRYDIAEDRLILVDLKSSNGTFANDVRVEQEVTVRVGDKIRLGTTTILRVSLSTEPEAAYARKMYQAALRDGLTGAFNRRYLDERMLSEIAFAERHAEPLALLLLDLDRFKQINDSFGHIAGDAVLQRFVELINGEVRTEDVVARYGGEEFAVLCRDTTSAQAMVLGERLRAAVAGYRFEHDGDPIPTTVSIGVATTEGRSGISREDLVEAADRALYEAKTSGRNLCRCA